MPRQKVPFCNYNDVIMGAMASQTTSLTIVYTNVDSGAYERKHQSSASLAFVRGNHRSLVNSPYKGPVPRKIFPFDDVIMMNIFLIWNPSWHRWELLLGSTLLVTCEGCCWRVNWNPLRGIYIVTCSVKSSVLGGELAGMIDYAAITSPTQPTTATMVSSCRTVFVL